MKARTCTLLVAATLLSTASWAERKYSDWGPAVNLGCQINSPANDFGPGISKDGFSLYFSSNRGQTDPTRSEIYVAQRPSTSDLWGSPQNLGPTINSPGGNNPTFSRDGHWMFFNSSRAGGFGDTDIWASYREHVHDDFAWETPFNLGAGVNATGFEAGPSYFENEDGSSPVLYFGRADSGSTQTATSDIWIADLLPDGTFGNARLVPELSSLRGDQRPSIRFDGLEIFFFSNRPGSITDTNANFTTDIWVATRSSVNDAWDEPTNLGANVNTQFADINPQISADGLTLYFASNRPGGCGGNDLYMTSRTRLKGHNAGN